MGRRAASAITLSALLAAAVIFSNPRVAMACSCSFGTPVDLLGSSDLAFVGTLVDQQQDFAGTSTESLIAVETVVKGDVKASMALSAATDSECGLGLGDGSSVGVVAMSVSGQVLPQICAVMSPGHLLAAADELGMDVFTPDVEVVPPTALPESASNYAAAIPLSIALSLVFLGAVALGTRSASLSSK